MSQGRLLAVEPAPCDLCGEVPAGAGPSRCGHRAQFCPRCVTRLGAFGRVVPDRSCPDCGMAVWEGKPKKVVV